MTLSLAVVISSLATGGAQRVVVSLTDWWASRGHDVLLVTIDDVTTDRYVLHHAVKRVALNMSLPTNGWQAVSANLARVRTLRRALRRAQPDVIASFEHTTNVLTLLASRNLRIPVIVSERVDPREQHIKWPWAVLRRLMYPRASAIVVQTDDVRSWAQGFMDPSAITTIPNPVSLGVGDNRMSRETAIHHVVVALGRLTYQKGFDLLLCAFASIFDRHPDWSLVIYGDGEERDHLEALIAELGIASRATLAGMTDDPLTALRGSDLFVLSSRWEGFPNALLEAMACGLPVIATNCQSGPREVIRDGVDGLLVPPEDPGELAAAMERLITNPHERVKLAERAKDVSERFRADKIMAQWDELILRLSRKP